MDTYQKVLLIGGIGLVFFGLIVGMDATSVGSVKNPYSRWLMIGGVSMIGVWFGIRFFGDMTKEDPEVAIEKRRKERELEKAERRKKEQGE